MPKPWKEVEASQAYRAMSPADQAAARAQYFDAFVAPRVPAGEVEAARAQFTAATQRTGATQPATRTPGVLSTAQASPAGPGRAEAPTSAGTRTRWDAVQTSPEFRELTSDQQAAVRRELERQWGPQLDEPMPLKEPEGILSQAAGLPLRAFMRGSQLIHGLVIKTLPEERQREVLQEQANIAAQNRAQGTPERVGGSDWINPKR